MREIGLFEAKTNLSALVEQAGKGNSIVITKRGKPVAKLVPYTTHDAEAAKAALETMQKIGRKMKPTTLDEMTAWKNEGRR